MNPIPAATLLLLAAAAAAADHVLWHRGNCDVDDASVTDAVCCHDSHCEDINVKAECKADITCHWQGNKCKINRDATNNVCCRGNVHKYCEDIVRGVCPDDFQVPTGCCSKDQSKYSKVLSVNSTDLVCCNTPCTQMKENSGCKLPDRCGAGPTARSFFGGGGGYGYQPGPIFNEHLVHKQSHGKIIPYTGFEDYEYDHDYLPTTFSHVPKVEEITVDDLMHSLVEALSNDQDAYEYNAETYTDPVLGKVKVGGHLGGLNFPDPNFFFSQIYGNHYGSALGQLSYYGNGGGYHGKPYSIAPQDIHGPSYFDPIYHGGHGLLYGGGYPTVGGGYGHGGGHYGGGYGGHGSQYGYGNSYGNNQYGYGSNQHGYGNNNQYGYGNNNQYGYGNNQYGTGYGSSSYGGTSYTGGYSPQGGYGSSSGYSSGHQTGHQSGHQTGYGGGGGGGHHSDYGTSTH